MLCSKKLAADILGIWIRGSRVENTICSGLAGLYLRVFQSLLCIVKLLLINHLGIEMALGVLIPSVVVNSPELVIRGCRARVCKMI